MKGYTIPFNCRVIQNNPPAESIYTASERCNIQELIDQLILKGAVEKCSFVEEHFISKIFLIPKSDGSNRFIINLKQLNQFVDAPHFKMEDGRTVIKLMSKNCYMASLDIKDAYYQIPIHESHKKYLRFTFNGELYQFTCLPFGLNTAPYVFTKVMKPVAAFLRQQGVTLVVYLDDIWIMGKSFTDCEKNVNLTENLLKTLGFIINYEKSQLKPSRICRFLGVIYNSLNMTVELPEAKRTKIRCLVQQFEINHQYKIQKFAEMLGFLVSCCPAVNYGLVYTKACERLKFRALLNSNGNYNGKLTINQEVIDELTWWKTVGSSSFNPIRYPYYNVVIFTDASKSGWGAVCGNESAHGAWKDNEKDLSINFLELTAAFFGLKCFANDLNDCQILLRIDNTTAISYINRMGGVQMKDLSYLAKEIWRWCEQRNIFIFASYITSEENAEADFESRKLESNTEFELSRAGFQKIVRNFGYPEIDLFASRSNAKCQRYVSWKKDPYSIAIDAFTIPWKEYFFYAFPPFSIILRVLQKIQYEKSEGIIIVPNWPSQPWYPIFQSMIISDIIYLSADTYINHFIDRETSFWRKITLVAAIISGKAVH